MASAAPPKRMVSSVFITLASPYRATVTQQQHALQTHRAPECNTKHTAVPVSPSDSMHALGSRRKRDNSASDFHGSTDAGPQIYQPTSPRPPDPTPMTSQLGKIRKDSELQDKEEKVSEEVFQPPLPPPSPETQVLEDSIPSFPPPPPLSLDVITPPPPPPPQQTVASNQQLSTSKPEIRTPSSGGDHDKQSPKQDHSDPEMTPESNEVCGFCRKTVAFTEPAIEALNRTYHESCFQCRQCQAPLAGKMYYNKAGIPLCEDCYQASLELCWACGEVIKDHVIRALERTYHPPCFTCATCSQPIGEQRFAQGEVGEIYCLQDYYRKYAPECSACKQLIIPREDGTDSYTVECLGRSFHEDCYRCEICATQLSPEPNDSGCYPLDGRVLCKSCHLTLVATQH